MAKGDYLGMNDDGVEVYEGDECFVRPEDCSEGCYGIVAAREGRDDFQVYRRDGKGGSGNITPEWVKEKLGDNPPSSGWIFDNLGMVEEVIATSSGDVPGDKIEFYHQTMEEGVDVGIEAYNKKLAESGAGWQLDDTHKERMLEVLKRIVPFMTPAEGSIIRMVLTSILLFQSAQELLMALGEEPTSERVNELMRTKLGADPDMDLGTGLDPSDTDKVLGRVSASKSAEEVVFRDEGEDPADAIMRQFRVSNN